MSKNNPKLGTRVPIGPTQGRALAALLESHPEPMHLQQIGRAAFSHTRQPGANASHAMKGLVARGYVWRTPGERLGYSTAEFGIHPARLGEVRALLAGPLPHLRSISKEGDL